MAILSSLAAVVSALGVMGCSSSSSPPPPVGCDMTKAVSFSKDVAPAFVASGCSIGSVCHGQMNNVGEENLFLGDSMGMTDPKVVYAQLVGMPSQENPSMDLVRARDTSNSFLWHKINGDQNNASVASGCTNPTCSNCTMAMPCGATMPYTADMALAVGEPANFCTISSWISQGAMNN